MRRSSQTSDVDRLRRRWHLAITARASDVPPIHGPDQAGISAVGQDVAADIADYQDSGLELVGVIGPASSPSCGVHTTLDLPAAVDVLRRCPLANLDRRMINEQVIGAHTRPGQGLFVTALQRQLANRGVAVRFDEYDFASGSKRRPPHRSGQQSL